MKKDSIHHLSMQAKVTDVAVVRVHFVSKKKISEMSVDIHMHTNAYVSK